MSAAEWIQDEVCRIADLSVEEDWSQSEYSAAIRSAEQQFRNKLVTDTSGGLSSTLLKNIFDVAWASCSSNYVQTEGHFNAIVRLVLDGIKESRMVATGE